MYYNLREITKLLGGCNLFLILPFDRWKDAVAERYDLDQLEEQTSKLTDQEELFTFVDGEETEALAIRDKYQLHELHKYLNDVFDGDLHDVVARPPTRLLREEW